MKYDCSKVLDYVHERKRMCDSYGNSCGNCELSVQFCTATIYLNQEMIDIVQQWSDEHPAKTRQDKLLEVFPDARTSSDGILLINPCLMRDGGNLCPEGATCYKCSAEYWNEVVE